MQLQSQQHLLSRERSCSPGKRQVFPLLWRETPQTELRLSPAPSYQLLKPPAEAKALPRMRHWLCQTNTQHMGSPGGRGSRSWITNCLLLTICSKAKICRIHL